MAGARSFDEHEVASWMLHWSGLDETLAVPDWLADMLCDGVELGEGLDVGVTLAVAQSPASVAIAAAPSA